MADYDKLYPTKKAKNDRIKELEGQLAIAASGHVAEHLEQLSLSLRAAMRDRTNARIEYQRLKDENAALRIEIDELRKHVADDIEHDVSIREGGISARINEIEMKIDGWSLTFDRDTLKVVKRG